MKENERLKEKIHNTFHKKQQLLIQQKCATAEAKEAEMYFELQEQYVCLLYIKNLYIIVFKSCFYFFLFNNDIYKTIFTYYRSRKKKTFDWFKYYS